MIDETGDQKKGTATVGTQRQYSGTTGRIENCQVEEIGFATKPALARLLIEKTLDAGVPAGSVTADEVYGNDPDLRKALHESGMTYVLAVAKTHRILTGIGTHKAVELAVRLKPEAWNRLSAEKGAKGERWYDWAVLQTTDPAAGTAGHHVLLIRRNRKNGDYAFYRSWTPSPVPVRSLVRIAGRRWTIEESFAASKELAALDELPRRGYHRSRPGPHNGGTSQIGTHRAPPSRHHARTK